jgi:hypothetical protein
MTYCPSLFDKVKANLDEEIENMEKTGGNLLIYTWILKT